MVELSAKKKADVNFSKADPNFSMGLLPQTVGEAVYFGVNSGGTGRSGKVAW
jgi:hypothetical protein